MVGLDIDFLNRVSQKIAFVEASISSYLFR